MSKKPMILNYQQAKELKFFCKSVIGTRQEYYEVFDRAQKFDDRLTRLEKTCEMIEKYLGEEIKAFEQVDWNNPQPLTEEPK